MKLSAIWSSPTMTTFDRFRRTADLAVMNLAQKLPTRMRYYATLQQISSATIDDPRVPAAKLVEDILRELPRPKKTR